MSNKIIFMGKPISVNGLYTGRRFLTPEGKRIKRDMFFETKSQWKHKTLKGNIGVAIDLFYSDNRRRDLDNPTKGLLDALTGIVFEDDSQVIDLHITKNVGENRTEITIYELQ